MSADDTRPRVVFLINSLTGGGAERIMARLITHSMARSHHYEMHLVLLDKAPEAYSVPDWIAVHRLGTAGSMAASLGVALRCLRPGAGHMFEFPDPRQSRECHLRKAAGIQGAHQRTGQPVEPSSARSRRKAGADSDAIHLSQSRCRDLPLGWRGGGFD